MGAEIIEDDVAGTCSLAAVEDVGPAAIQYCLARAGGRAHWPCWTRHPRKTVRFCPLEQMRLDVHLPLGQVRDLFVIINHGVNLRVAKHVARVARKV